MLNYRIEYLVTTFNYTVNVDSLLSYWMITKNAKIITQGLIQTQNVSAAVEASTACGFFFQLPAAQTFLQFQFLSLILFIFCTYIPISGFISGNRILDSPRKELFGILSSTSRVASLLSIIFLFSWLFNHVWNGCILFCVSSPSQDSLLKV